MLRGIYESLKTMRDSRVAPIAHDKDQLAIWKNFAHPAHGFAIEQGVGAFVTNDACSFLPSFTLHDIFNGGAQYDGREIAATIPAVAAARQPGFDHRAISQRFERWLAGEEMPLIIAMHIRVQANQPR